MNGLTRRRLLGVIGAMGAAGLGGAAYVAWRTPDYPVNSAWRVLDGQAGAVLDRLARLWLPDGEGAFPSYTDLPVMVEFDRWLGFLTPPLRAQFLLGMRAFDYLAFVRGGNARPFGTLDDDAARAYIDAWMAASPEEKGLVTALRQVLHLSYWRQPASWPATGYQGPLYLRADIPSLGAAPLPA